MRLQKPEPQRSLRRNWHILDSRGFYEGYRIPRFAYRTSEYVKTRHPLYPPSFLDSLFRYPKSWEDEFSFLKNVRFPAQYPVV